MNSFHICIYIFIILNLYRNTFKCMYCNWNLELSHFTLHKFIPLTHYFIEAFWQLVQLQGFLETYVTAWHILIWDFLPVFPHTFFQAPLSWTEGHLWAVIFKSFHKFSAGSLGYDQSLSKTSTRLSEAFPGLIWLRVSALIYSIAQMCVNVCLPTILSLTVYVSF